VISFDGRRGVKMANWHHVPNGDSGLIPGIILTIGGIFIVVMGIIMINNGNPTKDIVVTFLAAILVLGVGIPILIDALRG